MKAEAEPRKMYDGILAFVTKNVVPLTSTGKSKVVFYKMRGHNYRYLAESATGSANDEEQGRCSERGTGVDWKTRVASLSAANGSVAREYLDRNASQTRPSAIFCFRRLRRPRRVQQGEHHHQCAGERLDRHRRWCRVRGDPSSRRVVQSSRRLAPECRGGHEDQSDGTSTRSLV